MIIVVTLLSRPYNIWKIKVVQGLCNSTRNISFLLGYNSKNCVCGRSCINSFFLPNGSQSENETCISPLSIIIISYQMTFLLVRFCIQRRSNIEVTFENVCELWMYSILYSEKFIFMYLQLIIIIMLILYDTRMATFLAPHLPHHRKPKKAVSQASLQSLLWKWLF